MPHLHVKTKVRYWPGDPIDSKEDDEELYKELSSQRVSSAIGYFESVDFSRCIIAGCVIEFTLCLIFLLLTRCELLS